MPHLVQNAKRFGPRVSSAGPGTSPRLGHTDAKDASTVEVSSVRSSQSSSVSSNGQFDPSQHLPPPNPSPQRSSPNASNQPGSSPAGQTNSSHMPGFVSTVHQTTGRRPRGLIGASTTISGDRLFVFGGRAMSEDQPKISSALYELDLVRRHWTKLRTKGHIPRARYFHTLTPLGDTKLVCFGGMARILDSSEQSADVQSQLDPTLLVLSDVHLYDIPTRTWTYVATKSPPSGRYAHCAAILPSSTVFTSVTAPLSAIQHNSPSGEHSGTLGVTIDGTGGAELVIVGGQDNQNRYIEEVSVFNLRSLAWATSSPLGRMCGAYRSTVMPMSHLSAMDVGSEAPSEVAESEELDEVRRCASATATGTSLLIYSNYNFLSVNIDLHLRLPDGQLIALPLPEGQLSPPGLRFPTGAVFAGHMIFSGIFLTSSRHEHTVWALNLRSLQWSRIDTGSAMLGSGSWNAGILWPRRNSFVILGDRGRSLFDDYNVRRLNFAHLCVIELEAFGLYENPSTSGPGYAYQSASAPVEADPDGRLIMPMSAAAVHLGRSAATIRQVADMDLLSLGGDRIPVNSYLLSQRWGPFFDSLLRDGVTRSHVAAMAARESMATVGTLNSDATTLTSNSDPHPHSSASNPISSSTIRRPRVLYLPHTAPTIRALVHYLYTSELPPASSPLSSPTILCSLLQLARPYQVDGLLEATIERVHTTLDSRNTAAVFNAAAMACGGGEGVADLAGAAATARDVATPIPRFMTSSRATLHARQLSKTSVSLDGMVRVNGGGADDIRLLSRASTRSEVDGQYDDVEEDDADSEVDEDVDGDIWTGALNGVIGLQKRGLSGLLEGRRLREQTTGTGEVASVGLGIA